MKWKPVSVLLPIFAMMLGCNSKSANNQHKTANQCLHTINSNTSEVGKTTEDQFESKDWSHINGYVTVVDLNNSLAEISIGTTAGVTERMTLHISREDRVFCDLLVLEVEAERAIGVLVVLDGAKQKPQVGDQVGYGRQPPTSEAIRHLKAVEWQVIADDEILFEQSSKGQKQSD